MIKISTLRSTNGFASLTLVLIVITIISLVMIPIQMISYIRNNQAVRFIHSQSAFFAAEGAYAETVARIKSYPTWINDDNNWYVDDYLIPPNTIDRKVKNDGGVYEIDILAHNRIAQRRIKGEFTPETTTTTGVNYDIMLVLDNSGSMVGPPIQNLKEALTDTDAILDKIGLNTDNRIGVVVFSDSGTLYELKNADSTHIAYLKYIINNLYTDPTGATHISDGLDKAVTELNNNFIVDRKRLIIFFSDGVPQRSIHTAAYPRADCAQTGTEQPCRCDANECTQSASEITPYYESDPITGPKYYKPSQYDYSLPSPHIEHFGSFCTNQAIRIATDARDQSTPTSKNNIEIYSVFLANVTYSHCGSPPRTKLLGQLTSFFISSEIDTPTYDYNQFDPVSNAYEYYYETANAAELKNIFNNIITVIITGGKASYGEAVPE
jgi:hypothetical protein